MIELLVVIAILGVLAGATAISIRINLIKSRDAARKSDLNTMQKALEMYVNDNGSYPVGNGGKIIVGENSVDWGEAFELASGAIYMSELPVDPTNNPPYCYQNGATVQSYQLYARLENLKDSSCLAGGCGDVVTCNGNPYNYGVSSPNVLP